MKTDAHPKSPGAAIHLPIRKPRLAVVSVRENPNEHTARVNLRWEGKYQISDFDLDKLGTVLNSEDETEHSGWAIVESPVKATIGKTIPLLKEAK